MTITIDLNCDLGESFGHYNIGHDEQILDYISSANIACGFHAGDPHTMRKTVQLAIEKGVAIGAHPGLPDLNGFGRRKMEISEEEAYELILYQVGALQAFVQAQGGKMQHVKPHGALYNMAAVDQIISSAIVKAIYDLNKNLIIYGLHGSQLVKEGNRIGLKTASEGFIDRVYQNDGTLTPRKMEHSLIQSDEVAIRQAIQMVKEHSVDTYSQKNIPLKVQTICLHGDHKDSLTFAKKINHYLKIQNISIENFSH
ncbi:5-oxoprolinase subunit PxpA [Bacillus carboniphilus]|uniref:5-oxoprolinase subunit A n=1 Tax=Bacillus carboniphilus TaxID=86663 RepID=A0ABY9JVE7_9BACI|nr:5-oxoprolinase subunit PxpA [Bacillus carboniphilus]WLR42437.1 5-oxoprolinase subunit PxpA [Bacillus carboniphilus]